MDHKSQLNCRRVSHNLKVHVDQPYFWIQKCDQNGQTKIVHDAWIDLLQDIEQGSDLEHELSNCLMEWHEKGNRMSLILWGSPIEIVSRFGRIELFKYIASKIVNANAPASDGWTQLQTAARYGHTEIVKFLAPKVENPNAPTPDRWTPIQLAAASGHLEIVKFMATKSKCTNAKWNDATSIVTRKQT